ncbi:PREDICTED: uncharacterized protein LOC109333951 [Lupinus angustifolius]|uniref:uncharacterized protein LOC109333951 n=1 Tax=Lupinus angustifolius TaxID=3871 RepID=UPI00092FA084|nr:PREDICTED: uncharacterized protein LOC109333951 [Lupinus angustifolius]
MYKESKKKDCKAMFLLHQCVGEAHFEKISEARTTKEAWDILEKSNEGVEQLKKVRLQTMKRQYELMQMESNEKIAQFFNRIISHTNAMKASVVAIEESKNLEELKIVDLQGSLETHEQRLIERSLEKPAEKALQAYTSRRGGYGSKSAPRGRGRGREQRRGNHRFSQTSDQERAKSDQVEQATKRGEYQRWQSNKKRVDRRKLKCFNCNKIGHFSYECQTTSSHGEGRGRHHNEAYLAKKESTESLDDEPVLLMMTTNDELNNNDKWYIDSGCSNHMTGNKIWLLNFDENRKNNVRFADSRLI